MKHIYVACAFAAMSWSVCGQSNTVASGGSATGAGGSATFTVGQIDYSNASGATGSINQGVQQPFEFFKDAGIANLMGTNLQLYPNPTLDWITLKSDKILDGMRYEMTDASGRLIQTSSIQSNETSINMSAFSEGIYHLQVIDSESIQQSFKIIKH